jgi:hypothetical protein
MLSVRGHLMALSIPNGHYAHEYNPFLQSGLPRVPMFLKSVGDPQRALGGDHPPWLIGTWFDDVRFGDAQGHWSAGGNRHLETRWKSVPSGILG